MTFKPNRIVEQDGRTFIVMAPDTRKPDARQSSDAALRSFMAAGGHQPVTPRHKRKGGRDSRDKGQQYPAKPFHPGRRLLAVEV